MPVIREEKGVMDPAYALVSPLSPLGDGQRDIREEVHAYTHHTRKQSRRQCSPASKSLSTWEAFNSYMVTAPARSKHAPAHLLHEAQQAVRPADQSGPPGHRGERDEVEQLRDVRRWNMIALVA